MTTTAPSLDTFLHRVDECSGAALSREESFYAATAPGVVDVMGGMAEPYGVEPLNMLLAQGVTVGIQKRHDQVVELVHLPMPNNGSPRRLRLSVDQLSDRGAQSRLKASAAGLVAMDQAAWARPVAMTLHMLFQQEWSSTLRDGLTVYVETPFAGESLELSGYPISSACIQAALRTCGVECDSKRVSALVLESIRALVGLALDESSASCVCASREGALRFSGSADGAVPEWIDMPTGVAMVVVDCGLNTIEAVDNYRRARLATLMGIRILDDTFPAGAANPIHWRGRLADITINDYVTHVRHRLPTKMKGCAFLDRFGGVADVTLAVDPDAYYKIRSRTEHPVYEQARVRQFAGCMLNAVQSQRLTSLLDAGDLMYASHWSYGQRCAMGSIVTDALVSSLRKLGASEGVYGARISGIGSGGIVVVLISDSESARSAVRNNAEAVASRLGTPLRIYEVSRTNRH